MLLLWHQLLQKLEKQKNALTNVFVFLGIVLPKSKPSKYILETNN